MSIESIDHPGEISAGLQAGRRRFGRFTLAREVAFGAATEDWLAQDETRGVAVLLRFLPATPAEVARGAAALRAAAEPYLQWRYPGLARLDELVIDEEGAAFVSEPVPGTPLAQLAAQAPGGVLELEEVRDRMLALCRLLEPMHSEGVVHGDLKPAQLVVDGATTTLVGYGCDVATAALGAVVAARTGTPAFMSPQRLDGAAASPADDIYAIGALMYALLVGRPPFSGGDVLAQIRWKAPEAMAERRVARLGAAARPIPSEWEALVARCLAKEPVHRPATVGEIAAVLEAAPLPPRAEQAPAGRLQQWAKNPAVWLVAVVVLLVGMVGYHFGVVVPREHAVRSQKLAVTAARRAEAAKRANDGKFWASTVPDGAMVEVGDNPPFRAPGGLSLAPGRYPVRARARDHEDWSGEVQVFPQAPARLKIEMTRSTGTVTIAGKKGAKVFAGDQMLGYIPLVLEKVPAGPVSYWVREDGFTSKKIEGTVAGHGTLLLTVDLQRWEGPSEGQRWTVPDLEMSFVWIKPGEFQLGPWMPPRFEEKPKPAPIWFEVKDGFWLGCTEVTQRQWLKLMERNYSAAKGDRNPVENVTWDEAVWFCARLNEREREAGRLPEGYEYSLPESMQWELACRGGVPGDYAGDLRALAWFDETAGKGHHPVATAKANAFGLHDMHGNVSEWVLTYSGKPYRGIRGGGWRDPAVLCRASFRTEVPADNRTDQLGFRVALRKENSAGERNWNKR